MRTTKNVVLVLKVKCLIELCRKQRFNQISTLTANNSAENWTLKSSDMGIIKISISFLSHNNSNVLSGTLNSKSASPIGSVKLHNEKDVSKELLKKP